MQPDVRFWRDKKVLLTGHTGFKGGWLALWLARLGARVVGVALPPAGNPNLFVLARIQAAVDNRFCDIRRGEAFGALIREVRPDIVFHLAAQPLVRAGYREPVETFSTNVIGTVHLLEALRHVDCRVAVVVTTDKVYKNREYRHPYREEDALGGDDPYSASKAACEMAIQGYRAAFLAQRGTALASARAGNVIGGGDWSEDRLIPDAIRAWQRGNALHLRRPDAVRPWQHVLEPLFGYLRLAETLWEKPELAGAYNFGPQSHDAVSVREIVELARPAFPKAEVSYAHENEGPHEAASLSLDISKASAVLGVTAKWSLQQAVERTLRWYLQQSAAQDARGLCEADIHAYENGP